MKQRKIAISLAVIGAIAAPFVFRTYKMHPTSETLVPYTVEEKEDIAAYLKRTNNCQLFTDRLQQLKNSGESITVRDLGDEVFCELKVENLKHGGEYHEYFSVAQYLAWNVGIGAAAFGLVFGITYLLPALARRYWRWLNT